MTEQTIQSRDINITEVFQAFYAVPDYQREYVWQAQQVEQLLDDVNAELTDSISDEAPEYFIGSIVVCPRDDGVFDLIDGQQRMTTLFLVLCAIRDRIKLLGEKPSGALASQIAAEAVSVSGRSTFRYRLDLQYEDSGDILVRIAKGENVTTDGLNTRSVTNIHNTYQVATSFLTREFKKIEDLLFFYGYLTNKVRLIRIQTEDVAKALKVFETINDRGVGLDSMDLLKNLLFMRASRNQFDKLRDVWKDLQDTIYDMNEKPLRFLRYFILSRYRIRLSRTLLREDETYAWFSKNDQECGYGNDPIAFAKELLCAAQDYRNFWKEDIDPRGSRSPFLQSLRLLAGGATRQHLILLLAGRHLSKKLFNRLAHEIENMLFVSFIVGESSKDLDRIFARWAGKLREVMDADELDKFIEKRFTQAKAERSRRFDAAFQELYAYSIQKYRMRYILAKVTQRIDLMAYDDADAKEWLSHYMTGFDVEHIFPQQPSRQARDEFGNHDDDYISERLGNLVLVEKAINASLGNKAYSKKKHVYPQSQLLLTRVLSKRLRVGVNTKIDRAVAVLESFEEWNQDAVNDRQESLCLLAHDVWEIPSQNQQRRRS